MISISKLFFTLLIVLGVASAIRVDYVIIDSTQHATQAPSQVVNQLLANDVNLSALLASYKDSRGRLSTDLLVFLDSAPAEGERIYYSAIPLNASNLGFNLLSITDYKRISSFNIIVSKIARLALAPVAFAAMWIYWRESGKPEEPEGSARIGPSPYVKTSLYTSLHVSETV